MSQTNTSRAHNRPSRSAAPDPSESLRPLYELTEPRQSARTTAHGQARGWTRRLDCALIILAFCSLYTRRSPQFLLDGFASLAKLTLPIGHVIALLGCIFVWLKLYELAGLYRPLDLTKPTMEFGRLALFSFLGTATTAIVHSYVRSRPFLPDLFWQSSSLLWILTFLSSILTRVVTWRIQLHTARATCNVLIVGSGPRAVNLCEALIRQNQRAVCVVGFVDNARHPALAVTGRNLVGQLQDLEEILTRIVVDEVYIALPLRSRYHESQHALRVCERIGARVAYCVEPLEHSLGTLSYEEISGRPVAMSAPVQECAQLRLKRAFDVIASVLAMLLLSPLLLVIAILVKATSAGPVLFRQERFGQNKRRFLLYKFRSMRIDAEDILQRDPAMWEQYRRNHFKLPEHKDPRLTGTGRLLRKSSLDELPQLWNVFKGDMSIIGPRPIIPDEMEHYGPFAALLLALKPGLTGPWVAGGRSHVGYPQRAELELSYIRQWSLWNDLKIIVKTIPAVLFGRGAF